MKFFDSHCHLQLPQFNSDREEVITRMKQADFGAIVVGTDLSVSRDGIALAEKSEFLWSSVGLHPNDSPGEKFNADLFRELAQHPKVVAIGECGLDYFRSGTMQEERLAQKEKFTAQVVLSVEVSKPLIIHCRDAHTDMLQLLAQFRHDYGDALSILMHFFTASEDLAKEYLALGCYLSFPGPITYTNMYDASIYATPIDRMLVETDSPFAAPVPYRGRRNEPIYVVEVLKKVASLKNCSVESMREQLIENAHRMFVLR